MRGAVLAAAIVAIAPSAAAFAVYRTAAAIVGLLEHANLCAPRWLRFSARPRHDLAALPQDPHSRVPAETDSNYGNLFSVWDRLFGTMTPSHRGTSVAFGLERLDRPELQTTAALLAHPFRPPGGARARPAPEGARG
jgi:sterol desaturase/sphingolipid hydroxylase (fatty acid hydroxylase superfamily)